MKFFFASKMLVFSELYPYAAKLAIIFTIFLDAIPKSDSGFSVGNPLVLLKNRG